VLWIIGGAFCIGSHRHYPEEARQPNVRIPRKVTKGGSYLCMPNCCRRYRPAVRMAQPIDTSICHLGFCCVIRPGATTNSTAIKTPTA